MKKAAHLYDPQDSCLPAKSEFITSGLTNIISLFELNFKEPPLFD